MMIFKCAGCGAVSYTENHFKCPICGERTIGFKRPSIEPQRTGIDVRRIMYGVGVGALFVGIGAVIFLGCLFGN